MKKLKVRKNVCKTKNIDTAINRAKKHLMEFASKNGIYENFGIEYYQKLQDKYIDVCDYFMSGQAKMRALSSFSDWCGRYTPTSEEI